MTQLKRNTNIQYPCPECGGRTYITDARRLGEVVRRKRTCEDCGHRFLTNGSSQHEYSPTRCAFVHVEQLVVRHG